MNSNHGNTSDDRSTTVTTSAVESTKTGRGRGQRGGRGRGRTTGRTPTIYNRPSFIGREPTLKHDIFDYQETQQAQKYRDNIEALKIYIGRKHTKYTVELVSSLDTLNLDIPEELDVLTKASPTPGALKKWELDYKKREEQREIFHNFLASFYALIWGQCTLVLRDKLRSHATFHDIEHQQNGLGLLKLIKTLTHTYDNTKIHNVDTLDTYKWQYMTMKKHSHQSIADFYQQFQAHVQMCEEMDVQLYEPALALSVMAQRGSTFMMEDDKQDAHRQAVAMRFIRACGHGEYLQHLRNSFLDGKDIYPKRISDAFTIMDQRVPTRGATYASNVTNNSNEINTGIAFPTRWTSTTTSVNSGSTTHSDITTTLHNQSTSTDNGAYRSLQPIPMTHTHSGMIFSTKSDHNIPMTWILLDNQATTDIFGNANLLKDIHEVTTPLYIHGITGVLMIKQQGTLPGHGAVWYHPQVSVNILSMAKLKQQYHITYDSGEDNAFIVREHDNTQVKNIFHESDDGLYYHDVNNTQQIYITTVTENKQKYSHNDVKRADGVRALQKVIGQPTAKQLSYLLDHHLIPNSPFTSHDVRRAEQIYGPDLGNLKGKTTRRNPPTVDQIIQQCPNTIIEQYGNIMLSADVMHVNGIPFFITRSRHIHFGTVDVLPSLQTNHIGAALCRVVNIYARGGFQVTMALMDGAFAGLHDICNQLQIKLNTTSRDEHVGDVERYIRTVKERMRGISNTIPFKRLTHNMVMELAKAVIYWLNSVPSSTGVSPTMSPRTIITGQLLDYHKHCRYEFGEYVQTHEEHDNSLLSRTVGAIALRPTGNQQGGYFFMSLHTGRIINRLHATKLPMPSEVIIRVDQLAKAQNMTPSLAFGNRDNRLIAQDIVDDDETENAYIPTDEADSTLYYDQDSSPTSMVNNDTATDVNEYSDIPHSDMPTEVMHMNDVATASTMTNELTIPTGAENDRVTPLLDVVEENDHNVNDQDSVLDVVEESDHNEDDQDGVNQCLEADIETPMNTSHADSNQQDEQQNTVPVPAEDIVDKKMDDEMDAKYGTRSTRWNLRQRKQRTYDHKYDEHAEIFVAQSSEATMATPQMPIRRGLKMFGSQGISAVKAELQQLHDLKVMKAKPLTTTQRWEALGYLMFLKRKRSGKIKARGCGDGRPQRAYIPQEDARAHTVSTEAVFMTAVIDAIENRMVAVVDIPGAFMQADMDPGIYMRIEGAMAELLMEIDYDMYHPHMVMEKEKPVIYVELLKALYGTLRAARLFWETLSGKLQEWGFTLNAYDSCVANKQVDGHQCTITWHVDDLKISHVDGNVVRSIIQKIQDTFGQHSELSMHIGKRHDYLGMILDFTTPGILEIDMSDYIQVILQDTPTNLRGTSMVPAAKHLFTTRSDAPEISSQEQELFHHLTMQLMYLSQRGRPDIRTAVAFLSSRVANPDQDDYMKLGKLIKYLESTLHLTLRLQADETNLLQWWVDAAYATHPDMKGHTGATFPMGHGSIYSNSLKQKLVA